MRIFLVCVGEPIPTNTSNVRLRRVGMLASLLAERGHDVHWISSTFDHYKKIQLFENDTIYEYNNFHIHALKTKGYKKNVSLKRIMFHKKIAKSIAKYLETLDKPDVILASMEPIEVSRVVTKYAKKNNINTIIDVRDLWPEIFYDVFPKSFKPLLFPYVSLCKKQLNKLFKDTTAITGASEGFLNYGLKYSLREKKKYDKHFNMGYFSKEIVKKDNGYFNVIFIGTIGKQFDLIKVLDAAKRLEQYEKIKFLIAGDGENLPDLKEKYGFLKNVEFLGWIENDTITELLSIANISVAPYINSINYQNNMPNKIGEYLSVGLPVFVNCDGVIKDTVMKYNCGCQYANADQLAEMILELYENENKYSKLKANAIACFESEMNATKIYQDFCDYVEEVAINKEI